MTDKLENINQINLEFNGSDDDDSFIAIKESAEEIVNNNNAPVKTGIIIKFDDDEDIDIKKHSSNNSVNIPKTNTSSNFMEDDIIKNAGYNQIDMECKYCDDEEDIDPSIKSKSASLKSMFADDDEDEDVEDSKELVLEDSKGLFNSNKVTVSTLEDDFWKELSKKYDYPEQRTEKEVAKNVYENLEEVTEEKKVSLKNILKDLQKKHEKSNKKGAMGMSFHYAGNPEKSRELFNKGIGAQNAEVFPESPVSVEGSFIGNGISTGDSGVTAASDASVGAGDGGMGESLHDAQHQDTLNEIFDVIGFKVFKTPEGTFLAEDLINESNIVKAYNLKDLLYALQPIIEICIIIPLSILTKENFNSYKDWCDWYTEENQNRFPNAATDIKYCEVLANHLSESEV